MSSIQVFEPLTKHNLDDRGLINCELLHVLLNDSKGDSILGVLKMYMNKIDENRLLVSPESEHGVKQLTRYYIEKELLLDMYNQFTKLKNEGVKNEQA